jgi:1-acyl-sn-glycerol-3-phosphate acyltransferase
MIRVEFADRAGLKRAAPYIFVCNHRSMLDAYFMSMFPIAQGIQVANTWPFRIPVLGFYARMAGYLDINSMPPEEFFSAASRFLADGIPVIFFPEGTRSRGREMGNFHGAAFELFRRTRVPIIPVCITGNETVMPKGAVLLEPGVVRIRILPAVRYEDHEGSNVYVVKNRVRRIMQAELARLDAVS